MVKFLKRRYQIQVSPLGLGLLRIGAGITIFLEALQLLQHKELIFHSLPFVEAGSFNPTLPLLIWMMVLTCLTLGLWTKASAIANYLFTLMFYADAGEFAYHADYVYLGLGFLFMFAPMGNSLSIDRLIEGKKDSKYRVSSLYYYLFAFVGIGLVYGDSCFWKFSSPMWMGGLAVWLPASLPQNTWLPIKALLDFPTLLQFLGYLTLLLEISFLFIMWFNWARLPLWIVGVGLHLGIGIAFPIPYFALIMVAVYCVMMPWPWYEKIETLLKPWKIKLKNLMVPRLTRFKEPVALTRLNFKGPWQFRVLLGLFVVVTLFQMSALILSPPGQKTFTRPVLEFALKVKAFTKSTLGIQDHGVFMDHHFRGYDHVVALAQVNPDGTETFLPIINQKAQAEHWNYGRLWVYWTFQVMNSKVDLNRLARGIRRMTAYWLKGDLQTPKTFRVLVKRINSQFSYAPKRWLANSEAPWIPVGSAKWENGKIQLKLADIEKL